MCGKKVQIPDLEGEIISNGRQNMSTDHSFMPSYAVDNTITTSGTLIPDEVISTITTSGTLIPDEVISTITTSGTLIPDEVISTITTSGTLIPDEVISTITTSGTLIPDDVISTITTSGTLIPDEVISTITTYGTFIPDEVISNVLTVVRQQWSNTNIGFRLPAEVEVLHSHTDVSSILTVPVNVHAVNIHFLNGHWLTSWQDPCDLTIKIYDSLHSNRQLSTLMPKL
ncbi:hypothetical protein DPMN_027380 [Dreissena polymorpha]|uniref:Uncharacterized protein n=1 Tax=Dreissena polymorpha TaxID=45954 RepID=A0A9D4LV73_DREPO|nr:hypothetical protein DPMN_027380 [Dreissena polymorpha]